MSSRAPAAEPGSASFGRAGWPRLAVWLCLLAHLLGTTPLPGWTRAGWAALDGHHDVRLAAGAAGLRIVLSHRNDAGSLAGAPPCSTCPGCAILLGAASSVAAAETDHVLDFTAAETPARLSKAVTPHRIPVPHFPPLLHQPVTPPVTSVIGRPVGLFSGVGLAPPTALQVARSVVLLV